MIVRLKKDVVGVHNHFKAGEMLDVTFMLQLEYLCHLDDAQQEMLEMGRDIAKPQGYELPPHLRHAPSLD